MKARPERAVAPVALVGLMLALCLGGCATRVTQTGDYVATSAPAMPRPQRVLVADFIVDPQAVRLDQGLGPRVMRTMGGGASEATPAREVQDAIAEELLTEIRKMGLPAGRVTYGAPPMPNELVVQGQIVKIDEGNRTRRLAIGFGAGKSEVEAEVQVYYSRAGAPAELLRTYDAESNSGRKPGMGIGVASAAGGGSLAPAALSGAVGVHTEKQAVAGEGQHLADRVAYNLGELFVQQGWIPASAAPSRSLR